MYKNGPFAAQKLISEALQMLAPRFLCLPCVTESLLMLDET